jgi:Na+/melibiose symporter-like transporter
VVPNTKLDAVRRLDWWGFVLVGTGLAMLISGMELINSAHVAWSKVALGVAGGGGLLVFAIGHLLRRPQPLVNLRIMRIPTFRITNLGGSFFRMAISAVPFLLPLMFQDAFGWSPLKSGLLVIAVFAGNLGIKPLTTPLLRRFGFRPVLLATGLAATGNLAACGLLTARTPLAIVAAVLFFSGVFRSVGFTAYNTIAFADVDEAQLADANTLSATIQQLTIGLGVAIGALALRLAPPIAGWTGLAIDSSNEFRIAFLLIALLALLAVAESALLAPQAGEEVSAASDPGPASGSSPGAPHSSGRRENLASASDRWRRSVTNLDSMTRPPR